MAFTGKLGTKNSKFGNIVFGISDGLGISSFGINVHVISANEIRVRYTLKVTESALEISNYTLVSLATPGTAVEPNIIDVRFYDSHQNSVVLVTDINLTTGTTYSVEINDIEDAIVGEVLSGVSWNFAANVPAPPKALGAYQSKRDFIDIVFDKPVGSYSSGATFEIRDSSSPGPGVSMVQTPWAAESIPEDTLRIAIPGGTPVSNSFSIDYYNVIDESLNSGTESVDVTLALRSSAPYSTLSLEQIQITDAYIIGGDFERYKYGIIRIYWNGPTGISISNPESQFTLYQSGPHPKTDEVDTILSADATDLPTLITLVNEIKSKFNTHLTLSGVHQINDTFDVITSADATDLPTAITLLNEAQPKILIHLTNTTYHIYADTNSVFTSVTIGSGNLALAISVANTNLKPNLNNHYLSEQEIPFLAPFPSIMGKVEDHSSEPSSSYDVRSAYTYFSDLSVSLNSARSTVRILANVPSQDGFSSTSSADFTGTFTARSFSDSSLLLSDFVYPDSGIDLKFTGEIDVPNKQSLSIINSGSKLDILDIFTVASLETITSNLNQLIIAFNSHRTLSGSGAGHEQDDTYNLITNGVSSIDIANVIDKANELKTAINNHVRNYQSNFHVFPDPRQVLAADATDLPSLTLLVDQMRIVFLMHNQEGPHSRPGYRVYNSGLFDTVKIISPLMVEGTIYNIQGRIRNKYLNIPGNGEIGIVYTSPTTMTHYVGEQLYSNIIVNRNFTGYAYSPSLASAIPIPGIEYDDLGTLSFNSDQIEVYFSKQMSSVVLNTTNLPITGGSIIQKTTDWINERVASMRVVNMEAMSYTVNAIGLSDIAGNPVI